VTGHSVFQKAALRAVRLAASLSLGPCGNTVPDKSAAPPPSEALARSGSALAMSSLQDNFTLTGSSLFVEVPQVVSMA
jgi:hypothetical protein